jgi:hypothetical protein
MTTLGNWERRKILIWGKTRPEVSLKYQETVCTGGVFEDTKRLVRLYPIPLRYLDDERYFKKYQWIEADICRASADGRPESYRINANNIVPLDTIDTQRGTWRERSGWILHPDNVYPSVEALQEKQAHDHTSLGLVRPKRVIQVTSTRFTPAEKKSFWRKYDQVLAQPQFAFKEEHPVKPLHPPDWRFVIRFTCDDARCDGVHNFSVLDWEVDALYYNLHRVKGEPSDVAAQRVRQKLEKQCGPGHDTLFFLGNISNYPKIFTIVGFFSPLHQEPEPPDAQQSLLEGLP